MQGLTVILLVLLVAGSAHADRRRAERHLAKGIVLAQATRLDDAIAEFQAAYAEYPAAPIVFQLASAFEQKGDKVAALTEYRRFLGMPAKPPAQEEHAKTRIAALEAEAAAKRQEAAAARGRELEIAGKTDEAIAAYLEAQQIQPRADLLFRVAELHERGGERRAALDEYKRTAALDPGGVIGAEATRRVSRLEGELEAEARSLKERQERAASALRRAGSLRAEKRWREAVESYRLAQENVPDPAILFAIAETFAEGGAHVQARDGYRRYLDENGRDRADEARHQIEVLDEKIEADRRAEAARKLFLLEEDQRRTAHETERAGARSWRTTGYIVGGSGLGVAVGGLALWLVGKGRQGSIEDGGLATGSDIYSTHAGAKTFATWGLIVGGVGVATLATGATFVLTHLDAGPYRIRLEAAPTSSGASLSLTGAL